MSFKRAEKSFSSWDASRLLAWAKDNKGGTIFLPHCSKPNKSEANLLYKGQKGTIKVANFEAYVKLLDTLGERYNWFECQVEERLFLIPSNPVTMALFLKVHLPQVYSDLGEPRMAYYDTRSNEFDVFRHKTHHKASKAPTAKAPKASKASKAPKRVETRVVGLPEDINGKELIGRRGVISKLFYNAMGCNLRVGSKDGEAFVSLSGPPEKMEAALTTLNNMISQIVESESKCVSEEQLEILSSMAAEAMKARASAANAPTAEASAAEAPTSEASAAEEDVEAST